MQRLSSKPLSLSKGSHVDSKFRYKLASPDGKSIRLPVPEIISKSNALHGNQRILEFMIGNSDECCDERNMRGARDWCHISAVGVRWEASMLRLDDT